MFFEKKVLFSILGGFVLGKAGGQILGSKKAKEGYLKAATGALIMKDYIMEQAENIQAEGSDILADARLRADEYQAKKDAEAMYETDEKNSDPEVVPVVEA